MSIRIERYIIFGLKFGEDFTEDFWKKDFADEMEWEKDKPNDKPFFLSDGMNGDYTYFGFIRQLSNGRDWDDVEETEIKLNFTKAEIIEKFHEFYPDAKIRDEDVKTFFLKHWV